MTDHLMSQGAATPAPARTSQMKRWFRHLQVVVLHLKLLFRAKTLGAELPPGHLDREDQEMLTDRVFAISRAKRYGPVFKVLWGKRYTTCVVGHAHVRRLLASNENVFPDETTDLSGLFPFGALRAMVGERHQKYRRIFIQALQATPLGAHEVILREWIKNYLKTLANEFPGQPVPGPTLKAALREITSGIMMRLLYGIVPGSPEYSAFAAEHHQFGPEGPPKVIEASNAAAFARIKQRIATMTEEIRHAPANALPPSFLTYFVRSEVFDDTVEGNLVYLFTSSHFDTFSLWRWMTWFFVTNPAVMDRVRATTGEDGRTLRRAIVFESLRLEQSEVLYRTPTADVVFDKYFIPKGSIMRGCLWEGHKDEKTFPDPFKFNPDRFIGRDYKIEEYAPFGLDKTRCIAANLSIDIGAIFVEILLNNFNLTRVKDGPAVFGYYHWEPNPEFSVILTPIDGAGSSAAESAATPA